MKTIECVYPSSSSIRSPLVSRRDAGRLRACRNQLLSLWTRLPVSVTFIIPYWNIAGFGSGLLFMAQWYRQRPGHSASVTSPYWLMGGGYSTWSARRRLANSRPSRWACITGWAALATLRTWFVRWMNSGRWWNRLNDSHEGSKGPDRGTLEGVRGTLGLDGMSGPDVDSHPSSSLAGTPAHANHAPCGSPDDGCPQDTSRDCQLPGGQLQ